MKPAPTARTAPILLLLGLAALGAHNAAGAPRTVPATGAEEQTGPSESEIRESLRAVAEADAERLLSDRAYAETILGHLGRARIALQSDPEALQALENVRLFALMTLERGDEARAAIDRMLAERPTNPNFYLGPWIAALSFEDNARALAVVETASRSVPGVGWTDLREVLDKDQVSRLLGAFTLARDEPSRVRLAEALFRIGWAGDDIGYADLLREILLDDRMRRGDRTGAAEFAAGISSPRSVLRMIVQPRYDQVFGAGQDRLALLRRALEGSDAETAAALRAAPQDHRRVLERAQFLRGLGREAEALALLEPHLRDVPATVAAGEHGMWLINEAAYSLVALDRNDEAARLMERLAALPVAQNPNLISVRINHLEVLLETGRHAEALERGTRLEAEDGQFASDFGKMWIGSIRACALARLGRRAEAAPLIERLRGQRDLNPAALMQAYLCVGNDDDAAALMVRRLESNDPSDAILALQDYRLSRGSAQTGGLFEQLVALRGRPEVRAALDRVGRVIALPLARTYWGGL